MPPVIGAVIAGVAAGITGGVVVGIVVGVATLALGFISQLLAPKPKRATFTEPEEQGITQLIRSAIEPQRVIYGLRVVSGVMTFADVTGTDRKFFHIVISLTGHEVEAIGEIFLNDVPVGPLDANGLATTGRFSGLVRIKKHLGTTNELADSDLVSEITRWTTDHRGQEIAYLYVRLEFNRDTFPTGVPNIKCVIRGRQVFDPRTGQTLWTSNSALCLRDYLIGEFGLKAIGGSPDVEIDESAVITAANICDELIGFPSPLNSPAGLNTIDFTVDPSTDILTQIVAGDKPEPLHLGDGVQLSNSSSPAELPIPLLENTTYFVIPLSAQDDNKTYKLAASLSEARESSTGSPEPIIDITSSGVGVHTITRKFQPRYTTDAVITLSQRPLDIVENLLVPFAGSLIYTQGIYRIFAGAYTGPAVTTITEADMRDEAIEIIKSPSKRTLHNAVRGTFTDQDNKWQTTEFPPHTNPIYQVQDGGDQLFKDINLNFVTDTYKAQFLAKLFNENARQALLLKWPSNLSALEISVMETIEVDLNINGIQIFDNKEFLVIDWIINEKSAIDLILKETAAAIFAFDPDADPTVVDLAPNTSLISAFDPPVAPTGLILTSGTAQLFIKGDGTVISRILASWTAPLDIFVTERGSIAVEFKESNASFYTRLPSIRGDATSIFIEPVEDGIDYDVRIASVNSLGVESTTKLEGLNHTVVGKTEPPANVTNFLAAQNGDVMNFQWTQVADLDLQGYEIRFGPRTASPTYADATPLTKVTRGTAITSALVPPGDWTFFIKAVDTSGNESTTADTSDAEFINTFDIILEDQQAPGWVNLGNGTGIGFVNHYTGVLMPESTLTAADAIDTFGDNYWTEYAVSPVATAVYEAAEQDIDFDDSTRIFAEVLSALGPGETVGNANPQHEIDHRLDAGAYDGFEPWSVGSIKFRFVKQRIVLTTADGKVKITGFNPTIDLKKRTEEDTNVTIGPSGTAITFAQQFHSTPLVKVFIDSASALIPTRTGVTTTGFTAHVFDTSGTEVGGSVDWEATGE